MNSDRKTTIIFGILIVISIALISSVLSFLDQDTEEVQKFEISKIGIDKTQFKKAPELKGIEGYINTTPEELKEKIKNKVVLYDIWTYSCINCIRTLPFITAWDEKYSDQGLLIIGIHSPEFEFEKDINNVKTAVTKHGINYPVVLDNDKETWDTFENRYWPRKYIADHEGYIRYDHIGEGAYDETEKVIQKLLKERADSMKVDISVKEELVQISEFEHSWLRTPELYFGFEFASGRNQLGNTEGFAPNQDVTYSIPESLNQHYFYLDGTWTNLKGSMKLVSDSGRIVLPYSGKEVNIVTAGEAELQILLDGKIIQSGDAGDAVDTKGRVHTYHSDLYNIIKTEKSEQHTLEILVKNSGFEIFTFTFG
jgi:thiol-disulfide isomerase/thioredoxin